jgi:hypothetical protein
MAIFNPAGSGMSRIEKPNLATLHRFLGFPPHAACMAGVGETCMAGSLRRLTNKAPMSSVREADRDAESGDHCAHMIA